MPYVVALLVAGLWAAFLLPSFFDHRSRAPKTTTADFARTKRLLQQVSSARPDGEAYVRHHAQVKRLRILIGLIAMAVVMLAAATVTGSVAFLAISIGLDIAFAGYVGLLVHMKNQRSLPRAQVVPIASAQPAVSPATLTAVPEFVESQTVRVIAG